MTLEEIKNAFVAEVEKVWHELTGTVDVDKARAVIADTAATLTQHVSNLGQHLFDHVLGNSQQPAEEAPAVDPVPSEGEPTQELATGGHVAGGSTPVFVGEPGPETLSLPQGDVVDAPEASA